MTIESININTGASLLDTLTSALYADPIVVFREYVQNAVDSFTDSPPLHPAKIEIVISEPTDRIIIRDNGAGIPCAKFKDEMTGLGNSTKYGISDRIGFRGIGRLAGLSFCSKIYFVNKAEPQNPQFFSLSGASYREILQSADKDQKTLQEVLNRIASETAPDGWVNSQPSIPGFEVIMTGISDELWNCIHKENKRNKTSKTEEITSPTPIFINELSMLLPVPYRADFASAEKIKAKYKEWLGKDFSSREFLIELNGNVLKKPFVEDEEADFQVLPIRIIPADTTANDNLPSQIIGLLWLRFNYVFKAVKNNWGIAVRSKNMLVRGGSAVAEEAANDYDAITSYGQYLSAIKGVSGELLLETDLLADNSRRDWFRVDRNSLQLRNRLCQLMNKVHSYRYKMSRFIHNDNKTEEDKKSVIQAYQELISIGQPDQDAVSLEQFIQSQELQDNSRKLDARADESDILGYSTTQKRFYREIMMQVYEYFEVPDRDITDYYKIKAFILKKLNHESIDSEVEEATGDGDHA